MGVTTAWPFGGSERHSDDYARLRHGRVRDVGLAIGQHLQSPPMLFTRDGHNIFLGDMYRGAAAFLVCGGPSLHSHNLSILAERGVLTMSVNNAATVVRPNLWVSVDDPGNFADLIWRDPAITKFVPICHFEKPVWTRDESGGLVHSSHLVGDMPAVFGFRRNEAFNAEQWLVEDSFNWGNHGNRVDSYGEKGSRSVMYVAIRLLHYLGVRTIYLLGCDFRMENGQKNYAFEQDRTPQSVRGNNDTYRILNTRLAHLTPHLQAAGLSILNCTPNSGLTAFEFKDFETAVRETTDRLPRSLNTAGMYDRKHGDRQAQRNAEGEVETYITTSRADRRRAAEHTPPDISEPSLPKLEIVSHSWNYARLLTFQLSSLVLHPPLTCDVKMTVCYANSDRRTRSVLDFFERHSVKNVTWNWLCLKESQLFRRAIGRNRAALLTDADWIWFCDCDYVMGANMLDSLAMNARSVSAGLLFPRTFFRCDINDVDAEATCDDVESPRIREIDPTKFKSYTINRAIGGLQVVRGAVARKQGYCRDVPHFMRPADRWQRTFEDMHFRKTFRRATRPVEVTSLFRIEHAMKGRIEQNVAL